MKKLKTKTKRTLLKVNKRRPRMIKKKPTLIKKRPNQMTNLRKKRTLKKTKKL